MLGHFKCISYLLQRSVVKTLIVRHVYEIADMRYFCARLHAELYIVTKSDPLVESLQIS